MIIRHQDLEDFRSVWDDVEIIKQEVVRHDVYDTVKAFIGKREKICLNT